MQSLLNALELCVGNKQKHHQLNVSTWFILRKVYGVRTVDQFLS